MPRTTVALLVLVLVGNDIRYYYTELLISICVEIAKRKHYRKPSDSNLLLVTERDSRFSNATAEWSSCS